MHAKWNLRLKRSRCSCPLQPVSSRYHVLSQCLDQPHERDAFVTLHRLLHTLASSAGTFGFAELGVRARKLEEDLQALLADVSAIESRIAKIDEELRDFLRWAATDPKGDGAAPSSPLRD